MNPTKQNASPARTLDRLLRAAARVQEEPAPDMPFGFDTRVISLSRQTRNGNGLATLLRRISLMAAAMIVLAIAGSYLEFNRNGDPVAGSANEFAIADSVIQDEVAQ